MTKITYTIGLIVALLAGSYTCIQAQPGLRLIRPNGGESLIAGSTSIIEWEGIAATETVALQYSTDNGSRWTTIIENAMGLQYSWRVPAAPSSQCLLRIGKGIQSNGPILSFQAHNAWINAAAFSKDGQRFATASDDHTARVWSLNGHLQFTLSGHSNDVWWASFSADGARIATASADLTTKIWNAASGQLLRTLSGHSGGVQYVEFSPDSRHAATASEDGTVKVWDVQTGQVLRTLIGHTNGVYGVTYSPDGQLIATASRDWTVKLWNAASGELIRTFLGHTGEVHSVRFSPDGKQLLTGSRDRTAKVWDVMSSQVVRTLVGHTDWVWRVAFSPDGQQIATAGRDATAKLWKTETGQLLRTLSGHTADVGAAEFNAEGTRLLTAANDQIAKIWNISADSGFSESDRSDAVWSIVAPVSAQEELAHPHESVSLNQNYPNPADNFTIISYDIANVGPVEIIVTNIIGEKVATLVDEMQKPGHYILNYDISSLQEGVYVYTLKTLRGRFSRRMVVR